MKFTVTYTIWNAMRNIICLFALCGRAMAVLRQVRRGESVAALPSPLIPSSSELQQLR